MDWKQNLNQLLGNATELVRNGQLADATRAIQQALGGAFANPATAATTPPPAPPCAAPARSWRRRHPVPPPHRAGAPALPAPM
ncbi:hypothetical protein [Acidovorax carolinensis]|uniref:hypothetical protein n=1 Tax=Acidovorax carolinensis TaxID=553814 RepID=UPI001F2CBB04|nr:hypothetical protein [Acidovorax carolinensis]